MLFLQSFPDYDITVSKKVEEGQNAMIELTVDSWKDDGNKESIIRNKQFIQEKVFEKKRSQRLYLGGAKQALGGSAVSALSGGRYSEGFHGCISFLKIRKRPGGGTFSYGSQVDIKTNKDNKNVYEWDNVFCRETCALA